MKLKLFLIWLGIVISTTWLSHCNDVIQPNYYDRGQVLNALADEVMEVHYNELLEKATQSVMVLTQFTQSPNLTSLEQARQSWKNLSLIWARGESFYLGPVLENNRNVYIQYQEKKPSSIWSVLSNYHSGMLISQLGSLNRGLPVIEFLLFNTNNGTNLSQNTTLFMYTNQVYGSNSKLYLNKLIEDVNLLIKDIHREMVDKSKGHLLFIKNAGKRNYEREYENINAFFDVLVNRMVNIAEAIVITKLGRPLNKKGGGPYHPTTVQAYESRYSLELIKANYTSLSYLFKGGINNHKQGLTAMLRDRGSSIGDTIEKQLNTSLAIANSFSTHLQGELEVNNGGKVEELYQASFELLRLIKVDLANTLTVTVLFSENDGD